jgi:hypothetical protein
MSEHLFNPSGDNDIQMHFYGGRRPNQSVHDSHSDSSDSIQNFLNCAPTSPVMIAVAVCRLSCSFQFINVEKILPQLAPIAVSSKFVVLDPQFTARNGLPRTHTDSESLRAQITFLLGSQVVIAAVFDFPAPNSLGTPF